jgi:hypothetical protein
MGPRCCSWRPDSVTSRAYFFSEAGMAAVNSWLNVR